MQEANGWGPAGRALSPVVAGALLIAILVLLGVVVGGLVLGLADDQPAAPEASLELQPVEGSGDYELVHRSGDRIDGDRVRIRGIENPDVLAGREFGAGDSVRVTPEADEVELVWMQGDSDGTSYIVATFDVDPAGFTGVLSGGGTLQVRAGSQLNAVQGDGGPIDPFGATGSATALGPAADDLDGDGVLDVPYVGSGGALKTVDSDGDTRTLATDGDLGGDDIAGSKTRLAVGSWDGSGPSVFLANEDHERLYRVGTGSSPTTVVDPDNGAQAVVGAGDVDGDGTDELVFADGSQTLRHVEPGDPDSGTYATLPESSGQTLGSSTGIGAGSLFDVDGDGQERVVAVDGGNDIVLVDADGSDEITSSDVAGSDAPEARQSPATVADVDGDGSAELVYLGNDGGNLKYLDGFEGYVRSGSEMTKEFLRDSDGDKVDVATVTGVTS